MTKVTILNTRPKAQAENTQKIFQKAGFSVFNFPCVQISSVDKHAEIQQKMAQITACDVIIFTSQNAVSHAFKLNPHWQIPRECNTIAVGEKTAQYLEHQVNNDIWIPNKQNSEGVIELLKGLKKINTLFLVTAKNGRNLIQNFAKSNNIKLHQLNVYQRILPTINKTTLSQLNKLEKIITLATSINTLENLIQLVPQSLLHKLQKQLLVCASSRIETYAHEHGFQQIVNCQSANPKIMVKSLKVLLQKIDYLT